MTAPHSGRRFDELAENYDERLRDRWRDCFAPSDGAFFVAQKCRALSRELSRQLALDGRRGRLLDAGCGQGTAFRFLRDSYDVFGSDVSLPMLRVARAEGPVVLQEDCSLPFASGSFDAAYAFCIYHHIAASERVRHLREIARVVRPGGLVCVFEHNPLNPVTRRVFSQASVDQGCDMIPAYRLRQLFVAAGLTEIRLRYVLFIPEALNRILGFAEQYLGWLPLGGQYYLCARTSNPAVGCAIAN